MLRNKLLVVDKKKINVPIVLFDKMLIVLT